MKTKPINFRFEDLSHYRVVLEHIEYGGKTDFWDRLYEGFTQRLANDEAFLDAITPKIVERAKAKKEQK